MEMTIIIWRYLIKAIIDIDDDCPELNNSSEDSSITLISSSSNDKM